ncbi:hypothetical protein ACLB2K_014454 [Fragaria x ananassa]
MQSPAESDYDSELYYYLFETRNIFTSKVLQANEIRYRSRAGVDTIPITFRHFQGYATYDPDLRGYHVDSPNLLLKRTLKLRFSREKASGDAKTRMERFARYKRIIARSPREANKLRNKLGRYRIRLSALLSQATYSTQRPQDTSNILPNEDMKAKIGDFGLCQVFTTENGTYISTEAKGNSGFLDPEQVLNVIVNSIALVSQG